ncbi:hypothetical protein F4804DRAFT_305706 [Jackrogersella minutella]|nr:hypothetical protein F4804DRAFT_305706 [Jackrogersella minutella]
MTVTELAWLTAASETITAAGKEATDRALNTQDEWFARNAPSLPKERENRGVGLFQQVEDPSVNVLTAHWESVDQHGIWLESPENKTIFPGLKDHFQLEKTIVFHYDAELFGPSGTDGELPLLRSPFISVNRISIAAGDREAFGRGWDKAKGVLEEFAKPYVVRAGWRVEKEEALEEFVLCCGWTTPERHGEFAEAEGFKKFSAALSHLIKSRDVKHYHRIL